MAIVKVSAFSVSLDGFGAGPRQNLDNPLGERGPEIFAWFFGTDTFQKMHGTGAGSKGVNNEWALKGFENVGAWILGRNMFGPIRGPWKDESWKGWWGDEPPYHVPTFVLTHHKRDPIVMKGGTTFYFVTDGIESALKQAKAAAKNKDVRIGGGVSTIRQYLQAGQIDQMHLVASPVMMGEGENLYAGLNLAQMGFKVAQAVPGEGVTHVLLKRS